MFLTALLAAKLNRQTEGAADIWPR